MDYHIIYLDLLFVIGLLAEAFILLGRKTRSRELVIIAFCFIVAFLLVLFGAITGKGNYTSSDYQGGVMIFAFVFSGLFAFVGRAIILPVINKRVILVWNLLFLYIYLQKLQSPGLFSYIIFTLSIIVIVNAVLNFSLAVFWKVLLYAWFLILIIYFALSQFVFSNLAFTNSESNSKNLSGLAVLFTGMAFLYIVVNVFFISRLIPLPSRGQTFKARLKEWKEDIFLMASKYSDCKTNFIENLFIVVLLVGILFINFQYNLVSNWFLVNLIIVLTSFFAGKNDEGVIKNVEPINIGRNI